MNRMIDFLKENRAVAACLVGIVAVFAIATAASGCSLGDIIQHDVPRDMQEYNGGEGKVSLNDAPFVMEDYIMVVQRNQRQFMEANDRAMLVFDFLNSLMTIGIEEIGNSPIPGATLISGMLLGVAGLMTPKPGSARQVAKEKEASFNEGQSRASEQMRAMIPDEAALRELLKQMKGDSA